MTFDKDLALEQYRKRRAENVGKRTDNAALPAGSPMAYFCRFCSAHTETLAEAHLARPITVCGPCRVLRDHGLIPEAPEPRPAMLRWFGESWGAPVCEEAVQADAPIDQPCLRCKKPIVETDQGFLIPNLSEIEGARLKPWHLDCFLRAITPGDLR